MKRSYTYLKGLLTLALAAFTGWMWAGVEVPTPTYWASFNNETLASDKVESSDGFSLTAGDPISYIEVSGSNKAWSVNGNTWGTQSILAGDATTFTLSVEANLGTVTNGLLYAFAKNASDKAGLALRRSDASTVVVTIGSSTTPVLSASTTATEYHHYVIVADNGTLKLYVDGQPAMKDGAVATATATAAQLINGSSFQPGRRFGGVYSGEVNGNGAIDEMTVWKTTALTAEQVEAFYNLNYNEDYDKPIVKATLDDNGTLASLNLTGGADVIAEITVADGKLLTIDAAATFYKVVVKCEGSAFVTASGSTENSNFLTNIGTLDCSGVTGTATYVESGYYSAIPFEKLKGIDVVKKIGQSAWTPAVAAIEKMGNSDLYLANGSMSVNHGGLLTNVGVITVDGATLASTVNDPLNTNNNYADGLVLKNGAVVTSMLHMRLPETVTVSGTNNTMSVNGVNNNQWRSVSIRKVVLEEDATATFKRSEEMASNANAGYHLWNSEFTIGTGATLTIDAPLMKACDENASGTTALTKKGAGELIVTAPTSDTDMPNGTVISVEAGTLTLAPTSATYDLGGASIAVSNGAIFRVTGSNPVAMSQNISGEGTIVADGATLNLASANLTNHTGSYSATDDATLTLPMAATKGKTIAVADTAKLYVVLDDVQKVQAQQVSVTGGTVQFVDVNGNPLGEGTSYTPELNTWTATNGTAWSTEANWKWGVPAAGADAVISITADTTITIPAEGVTVGVLTVKGEGTLTIEGGKITAGTILANTSIVADETTLALAPMDIAEGKTVTYTTTTTIVDPDNVNNVNHALSLKAMTSAGTFVKKGTGVIALFATAAEPAIVIEEGAIYVREVPSTAMNIAAKAGTEIRLAAWNCNFNNSANSLKLEGGAQLTLANKENVSGTITIANAAETAAKICGSSFSDSTISAAITGAGKVEFADGGAFNPTSGAGNEYPCQHATTYSGVISGDLQVIISDTSAVTFTGANTYTGGTIVAEGATLTAPMRSATPMEINGTLVVSYNASSVKLHENDADYSQITGTGKIKIVNTGTTDGWVTLPNDEKIFASTLALELEANHGLILTEQGAEYTFGTLSGSKGFRVDWGSNGRSVKIIQAANSEHSGTLVTDNSAARLTKIVVAGADGATEKTLTLSGDTSTPARPLEIDATGSVNITGTWGGDVDAYGVIAGTGTIGGKLKLQDGSTLDVSAGALNVTGEVWVVNAATNTATVKLPAEYAVDTPIISCSNAEVVATDLSAKMPEGYKCVADGNTIKLAVAKKTNFVVTVGEETVNCETVAEALEALAANGGSLQIAADADDAQITLADTLVITNTVTIDLNGKTITAAEGKNALHVQGGNLTIKDTEGAGKVVATDAQAVRVGDNMKTVADPKAGTFTLEAGTLEGAYGITVWQDSTVTIEGGTVKGAYAISGNGYNNGTTITINDGTIEGAEVGIYHPQTGTLTIDGGVISGPTGIEMRAGALAMSAGSVTGTGTYTVTKNGNGSTVSGAAIAISQHGSVPAVTANITGGTITADENAKTIAVANTTTDTPVCSLSVAADIIADANTVAVEVPTLKLEEAADGALSLGSAVAKTADGTKYATLDAALTAAEAGDTITLLADVTINSRLDIAQNVTIDLNGQTIAETMDDQFGAIYVKKGATLTIKATNGGEITTDGGIVIGNYGTVIVNGGTIAAGEDAEADVSIYNFYYQADWYGTTTINGGTVARIWNCGVATLVDGTITDVDNSGAMEITAEAEVTNILLRDGTDAPGIAGAGTLTAPAGLTVTTLDGQKAVYADGKYTVVKIVTLPEELVDSPAAEAIEAAMEAVGVTEITDYIITTTGTPNEDATVAAVAAVLEVFEVEPTVDANGVLTVAYEFGISEMTNAGDTITITAGVTGAEYREGVIVAFYADDAEIGKATTTADSTTVSITGISATDINGKKITVKAIKQ